MRILFWILLLFPGVVMSKTADNFHSELKKWQNEREQSLRKEKGWLSIIALDWLKSGENTIGSEAGLTFTLPKPVPARLAKIHYENEKAQIEFLSLEGGVTFDGKAVVLGKKYELSTGEKAPVVAVGSIDFFAIKRKNGVGLRVRDTNAEARKNFKGREWFSGDPAMVIEGEWHELKTPKKLHIPDVIGNVNEEDSPGYVTFKVAGKTHTLYPTKDGDELFFVIRDQTSGKQTYGAGRFLYAGLPKNGKVTLDFNRAESPPCAFTAFATCPLPPPENNLAFAVTAGEKFSGHGH